MRSYGREGITGMIRSHCVIAREFATWVEASPRFELSAPVNFSTVCFRYKGSDEENQQIVDRVNGSGIAFLSPTKLHGKVTLRIAIGNMGTTLGLVRKVWELIDQT